MLSIIVAVHNQLGHNTLFLEGIRRYTARPYEVIVIDNHSTDGSAEFFEESGCRVIRNKVNLCYPESMNLGIRASQGDYVCLINNDLYVAPGWSEGLVTAMEHGGLDAVSPLGLEMMPTPALTAWMQNRWATIGRGRLSSGKAACHLEAMIRRMYGNWETYCREVMRRFGGRAFDGIIGSCVMMKRSLFDTVGLLDERVQATDWDLYFTLRRREEEKGDVRRCMVVGDAYVHHFMRATLKGKREPFGCSHPRVSIDEKWTRDEQARWWCKPEDYQASVGSQPVQRALVGRLGKLLAKVRREVERSCAWRWELVNPDRILDLYRKRFAELA